MFASTVATVEHRPMIEPLCHACGVPPPLIRGGFAAVKFYRNTVCYCETKSLCQWLPFSGELSSGSETERLDKGRLSSERRTQVLLCPTSPSSSLRSMPPPLAGEALAFRRVFRQNQISFIENETSLPRALLPGELASGCETERLDKGRLSSERRTQVLLCTTSPSSSLRSMPLLSGEALAFRRVFQQTQIGFIENETSLPRAPLLGELSSGCETERLDKGRL